MNWLVAYVKSVFVIDRLTTNRIVSPSLSLLCWIAGNVEHGMTSDKWISNMYTMKQINVWMFGKKG